MRLLLDKSIAHRAEDVNQHAVFEADTTMNHVGLLVKCISCLNNLLDVTDCKFELAAGEGEVKFSNFKYRKI